MDEQMVKELVEAGIDVEAAAERFMGNMAAFVKFLKKFPADPNYAKLEEAVGNDEPEKALSAAHTLKGVCGNLSIIPLHGLFTKQVEHIRANEWKRAVGVMKEIRMEYERVIAAVAKLV